MQEIINYSHQKLSSINQTIIAALQSPPTVYTQTHSIQMAKEITDTLSRQVQQLTEQVNRELAPLYNNSYSSEQEFIEQARVVFGRYQLRIDDTLSLYKEAVQTEYQNPYDEAREYIIKIIEKLLQEVFMFNEQLIRVLTGDKPEGSVTLTISLSEEAIRLRRWLDKIKETHNTTSRWEIVAWMGLGALIGANI